MERISTPLPIASSDTSPSSMHREAARGSDAATLYLDDAMLADLVPFPLVEFRPRVHWTTYPLTIAGVCVALIFVLQLCRAYLGAMFA